MDALVELPLALDADDDEEEVCLVPEVVPLTVEPSLLSLADPYLSLPFPCPLPEFSEG